MRNNTKSAKMQKVSNNSTHSLLVLSALDHGWVVGHVGGGGLLITPPEVDSHLEVADHHAEHGENVCDNEEDNIVPNNRR